MSSRTRSTLIVVVVALVVLVVAGLRGLRRFEVGPIDRRAVLVDDLDVLDEPVQGLALAQVRAYRRDLVALLEREAHLGGGLVDPLGQLLQLSGELPTDHTILVVCRSGNHSAHGRDLLETAGFKTATSMDGGINDW